MAMQKHAPQAGMQQKTRYASRQQYGNTLPRQRHWVRAAKRSLTKSTAEQHSSYSRDAITLSPAVSLPPAPTPPSSKPYSEVVHGIERHDDFRWLQTLPKEHAEVASFIQREQSYSQAILQQLQPCAQSLAQQAEQKSWNASANVLQSQVLASVIEQNADLDSMDAFKSMSSYEVESPADGSVFGQFSYSFTKHQDSQNIYRVHYRAPLTTASNPETSKVVVVDEQQRKKNAAVYDLGIVAPSPDFSLIAFTEFTHHSKDVAGLSASDRLFNYTLHVIDATSGRPVVDPIPHVGRQCVWCPDGRGVFFINNAGRSLQLLAIASSNLTPSSSKSSSQQLHGMHNNFELKTGNCHTAPIHGKLEHVLTDPDYLVLNLNIVAVNQQPCQADHATQMVVCTAVQGKQTHKAWVFWPEQARRDEVPAANSSPASHQSDSWHALLPDTPGCRLVFAALPEQPGLLVIHWDVAYPDGRLFWCNILNGRSTSNNSVLQRHAQHTDSTTVNDTTCFERGPSISPIHRQILQEERQGLRFVGLRVHKKQLLVTYLVSHNYNTADQKHTSRLKFEAYDVSLHPSMTSTCTAGSNNFSDNMHLNLLAQGFSPVYPAPNILLHSFTWLTAEREQADGTTSDSTAHFVECTVSAACMPPDVTTLELEPVTTTPTTTNVDAAAVGGQGVSMQRATPSTARIEHVLSTAVSADGTSIPFSLSYKLYVDDSECHIAAGGKRHVLVYVYGAYGTPDSMPYNPIRDVLLDKGLGIANAHVRGGSGPYSAGHAPDPAWHMAGSHHNKQRGVEDLLAVAQALAKEGWVVHLAASSAGAWVAGAAVNCQPGLFHSAVLTVPSLDIVTAALKSLYYDSWYELGAVALDKAAYRSMLQWAPYNTLPSAKDLQHEEGAHGVKFPHMLIRVALQDGVVDFWESAKYVAKLRHVLCECKQQALTHKTTTQGNGCHEPVVVMQTQDGGHDAYDSLQADSEMAAFLLWVASVKPLNPDVSSMPEF